MNNSSTPLQRALQRASRSLGEASSAVWSAMAAEREFWPAKDRLRYDVPKSVLGLPEGCVDKLPEPVGPGAPHTLVSSQTKQGTHRPVLDLDAVGAALVPSTTPGNFHLYLDKIELSWREYKRFLKACERAGLITPGYLQHSLKREQTLVRRPGLRKTLAELQRKSSYELNGDIF